MLVPVFAALAMFAPSASAELVGPLPDLPIYPELETGPVDGSVVTTSDLTWTYSWNGQSTGEVIQDPMQSDYGTLTNFNCSLDGAPVGDCTNTFAATGLSEGAHTFAVNATFLGAVEHCTPGPPDPELDPCQLDLDYVTSGTRVIQVEIDTAPPTLSFTGGISENGTSNQSSQRFTFAAADAGAFATTCSVDGAGPATCTSPVDLTALGDGAHSLSVVAADANGHATTIARSFTVDTTAPVAAFASGPAGGAKIKSNHPTFIFGATDISAVAYSCSFDGSAAVPCVSPYRKSKLAVGTHVLVVTPTDAVGNIGPPIIRMFTYKPVRRCVKHKFKRGRAGKRMRVCAVYRYKSL